MKTWIANHVNVKHIFQKEDGVEIVIGLKEIICAVVLHGENMEKIC